MTTVPNPKVPPQSIEAEQSVLGAILLENEALGKAIELLTQLVLRYPSTASVQAQLASAYLSQGNLAEAEKGKSAAMSGQRIFVQQREADAVRGENESQAQIASSNAELEVQKATALQRAEVAKREAEKSIQMAEYETRMALLKAEEIAQQENNLQTQQAGSLQDVAESVRRLLEQAALTFSPFLGDARLGDVHNQQSADSEDEGEDVDAQNAGQTDDAHQRPGKQGREDIRARFGEG